MRNHLISRLGRLAAALVRARGIAALPIATLLACGLLAAPGAAQAAPTFTAAGQFGGSEPGLLTGAHGVAVDSSDGDVYVTDSGSVERFDSAGSFVCAFGLTEAPGGHEGLFATAVAVDPSNHDVYVTATEPANNERNVVDKFGGCEASDGATGSGHYLAQISGASLAGTPVQAQESSFAARGVAVNPSNGDLYVVDAGNDRVDVFNSSGVYQSQFGEGPGTGAGQFEGSYVDPAIDASGDVYVVDYGNNRVEKFTPSGGSFTASTFYTGSEEAAPRSVAVDTTTGDVYIGIANLVTGAYDIGVYDHSGAAVTTFGSSIGTEGGYSEGIAVNSSFHDVYIVDQNNNHVDIFSEGSGTCTPTVISSGTPTAYGAQTVTVTGELNPEGCPTTYHFQYGKTTGYGATAPSPSASAPAGTSQESVSAELTGLEPNSTYHFRLVVTAGAVSVHGEDETFTTEHAAPAVTTGQATEVQPGSATLNGTVNPENTQTTYHFQYGTSASYGSEAPAPEASAGAGSAPQAVSTPISGLLQDTTYHYRVVATNSADQTNYGADKTVDTATILLTTGLAGPVSEATATVAGTLDPGGIATTYEFQYGTSAEYGSSTPPQSAGSGAGVERERGGLTGLQLGTTYHYRLVATNSAGTAYGEDQTFRTYPATQGSSPLALSVGQGGTELTVPSSLPLLPTTKTPPLPPKTTERKPLTRAQKLTKALKGCKKDKSKSKRKSCDRSAHKRYGPKHKAS